MRIIAALFLEHIDMRQDAGGSSRLDLSGVYFSLAAPSAFPVTITPHLLVLTESPPDAKAMSVVETVFMRDDEQIARNIQPASAEPGKFGYNLVQSQLTFDEPGRVEAHCRIDQGPTTVVPLTVHPPAPADPAVPPDAEGGD